MGKIVVLRNRKKATGLVVAVGGVLAPLLAPAATPASPKLLLRSGRVAHTLPPAPAAGSAPTCATPATLHTVPDTAPIKRCPVHPLEQACTLEGGVKQGARWVWDADHGCAVPRRTETYEQGHRVGLAVGWRAVCAEKGGTCVAKVAEIGLYHEGKQHGAWQVYAVDGTLAEDRNYDAGNAQGWWVRRTKEGPHEAVCYRNGKETWRGAQGDAEQPTACPDLEPKGDDDGTVAVDENQKKASRMVALAQAAKNLELRVRYLRKACDLAPENAGYKKLLEAAEAEAAAARPAAKD